MNIIKRIIIVVAISLLVPMCMGCKLVAVGDSILWGSQGAVRVAQNSPTTENNSVVYIDGVIGRGLLDSPMIRGSKSLQQVVEELAPLVDQYGTLVIQDGANDKPEGMAPFMQWVNSYVRPDICIVWVYPYSAFAPDQDAAIREAIDANRHGHEHAVFDWHALASIQPELLVPDGVHPGNPVGTAAFAQGLHDAIEDCE